MLTCSWSQKAGSGYGMKVLIANVENSPKATLLAKMQAMNTQNRKVVNDAKTAGFTMTDESFSDTKSVFIGGDTTYRGMLAIIYRDTYGISISGEGFMTGQSVRSSFDSIEPCMKKAADAHAARQSGIPVPAPAGAAQPVPVAGTSAAMGEEDSLDDILSDMGDEINEDLPLPVNWTGVPEALGNSVTPAAAGATGALVGGIAGAIAVLVIGIPWPAGSTGGGGSEPPDSRPEPEPGNGVQEPGEGTPAAGSPAVLPAEPALPPPAEPPADASGAEGTVMAEPSVAPAMSAAATPVADGTSPDNAATAASAPSAPAGQPAVSPGIDPTTGKRVLTPDEEDLRDFIKQTIERHEREAAEWEDYGDVAGWYDTGATAVTTAADITLDIGSVLSPGTGSTIKNIYSAAKTTLSRATESYIGGEGFWWGMGKGAVEAAADKALDLLGGAIADKYKGKIPLFGKFEAPKGVDLGNVSPTELCKRLLGNKTPSYFADEARETMINAMMNFFQGQSQSKIIYDPIKQWFGISKPE
jgi:hypothetical protein